MNQVLGAHSRWSQQRQQQQQQQQQIGIHNLRRLTVVKAMYASVEDKFGVQNIENTVGFLEGVVYGTSG
ncbi:MAG: hypothetical protein Q9169_004594 [Polycauliona sp. 2 TL-2023]